MIAPTQTPIKEALAKATSEFIQSTTRLVDWVSIDCDNPRSAPTVQIPRHVEAWRDAICRAMPRSMAIAVWETVERHREHVKRIVSRIVFHA